jgi:hypothetical protein
MVLDITSIAFSFGMDAMSDIKTKVYNGLTVGQLVETIANKLAIVETLDLKYDSIVKQYDLFSTILEKELEKQKIATYVALDVTSFKDDVHVDAIIVNKKRYSYVHRA